MKYKNHNDLYIIHIIMYIGMIYIGFDYCYYQGVKYIDKVIIKRYNAFLDKIKAGWLSTLQDLQKKKIDLNDDLISDSSTVSDRSGIMMDIESLTRVQQAAYSLIQSDLRFLYTVVNHIKPEKSNYIPSLLPYLGVIIDGAEDWVKALNNSQKNKLAIPRFSKEEELFYEQIRNSIKLWQQDYKVIYDSMNKIYYESDDYFASVCNPIAKSLHLYDIYGVDTVNGALCGNTILCRYYSPFFQYGGNNGVYIIKMAEIGGKYIALFEALKAYETNQQLTFDVRDYGGFQKSPVGNGYSDRFVLLSILCQINFIIYCIEDWVKEEIPIKLRFAYLLYYSLVNVIPQINNKLLTNFSINDKWKNDKFRNAMAHYKLGVVLKEKDLIDDDIMFGLTDHILHEKYITVKESIYTELKNIAVEVGEYLHLDRNLVIPKSLLSLHN